MRIPYGLAVFLIVQVLGIAITTTSIGLLTPQKVSAQRTSVQSAAGADVGQPSSQLSPPSSAIGNVQVATPTSAPSVNASTANVTRHVSAPERTTSPRHATTTTTVSSAKNNHGLALGFAVFQPTGQFQNYQSAVGKLPNFLEWYQSWPTGSTSAPLYWGSQEQLVQENNLTPLISWSTDDIPLATVINGATDGEDVAVLAPAAALAKSYPGSLYIRLDWEMNGSWSAWNPSNAAQAGLGETPATFIAMWQHVVNYFRDAGVTNVKWVWSPNVDGGTNTMAAYYPGDNYVDDVALDGYNYAYTQGAPWLTPQQVFGASYAELEGITQKPVIIAETSSVEANSTEAAQGLSKALWIQQLSTYLPTLSNVIAVCWFDQPGSVAGYGTVNFSVNTSSAALGAWERDFVTNREYRGALRD